MEPPRQHGDGPAAATPGALPAPATIQTTPPVGALYQANYLVRNVKIYPMTESELTTLNLFSTITAGALSVASFVIGFGASIAWDVATSALGTPTRTLGTPMLVFLGVVLIACAIVGGLAIRKRGSELRKVISESKHLPMHSQPTIV